MITTKKTNKLENVNFSFPDATQGVARVGGKGSWGARDHPFGRLFIVLNEQYTIFRWR